MQVPYVLLLPVAFFFWAGEVLKRVESKAVMGTDLCEEWP